MAVDWAIEAPARNRAAPAERSPKGDSVSDINQRFLALFPFPILMHKGLLY